MRILYFNDAWAIWGGLERVLIDKMNYLADDEGYEIFSVTYNQGTHPLPYPLSPKIVHRDLNARLHRQYRYRGLKRYYFKYRLQKLLTKRLKHEMEEIKPDVIVCPRIDLLSFVYQVKGSVPLVFESHSSRNWISYQYDGLIWQIKQRYYEIQARKAQMIVALTEGDAAEWRKLTPHVCLIPNVVHLNETGNYCDYTAKSAIFVGRFCKQKDIASLLRIWTPVHQRHSEWSLHIYGGFGDEQETFYSEIKRIDANIIIHEPTFDIFKAYKESSMLLLTSLYEPFGLVLPEAMSCGLPVVSFDCPYGPSDIISDGVDGFLVRHRNIEEFADKVCLLMENLDLRTKMGKAGILSSMRYDASTIMPLWKAFFKQFAKK